MGATCADVISYRGIASEVVLLDIKEGFAEGKAMDIMQCATNTGFNTKVIGVTNDYSKTANSDVVVITSGIPRKPGMTREELIGINAGIVKTVAENILVHSPNTIVVVVSNPMDTMTYLALKSTGLPKNRIIGMGGALDSSRFRYYLSQALDKPSNDVSAMVIGGHGDTTMIPLTRLASYNGIPVSEFLSQEELDKVAASTMVGGATLTGLLGTSAWYAPGAAGAAARLQRAHPGGRAGHRRHPPRPAGHDRPRPCAPRVRPCAARRHGRATGPAPRIRARCRPPWHRGADRAGPRARHAESTPTRRRHPPARRGFSATSSCPRRSVPPRQAGPRDRA